MKNLYRISAVTIACFLLVELSVYGQVGTQIPLNPKAIPQFVDPLPHFAGLRVDASGGNLLIKYEPVEQIAVSSGTVLNAGVVVYGGNIGKANLWGYSVSNGTVSRPGYWPAFSIEVTRGIPVNVTYENNLAGQTYADVGLKADQTLHWANPLGASMMEMTPYNGPIPVVPHLHGAEVASESDGGPDAWFTPGYAVRGPSWGINGTDQYYHYLNTQEAATLWWHDHALGATRLNVYAGLAGFYLLRGSDEENDHLPGWSGDDLVREVAPAGTSGTFNPDPYLPEIEIVFQDRMFDTDGKLYYPNLAPNPAEHPYWTPEFIGDVITVNGKTWPYLSVAPRKYRFRLLNGSNARFYAIHLQDLALKITGPPIVQIGTDGGLMDSPVTIAGDLLLSPGERADVVIDFSGSTPGQKWTLINSARAPYPKGSPPNGSTIGRIMQFVVSGQMVDGPDGGNAAGDNSLVPASLRSAPIVRLSNFAGGINVLPNNIAVKRQLTLNEVMGMGGPLEVLVNNSKWAADISEKPVEGTTELWQIINLTADAHPIHLHLVQFQIVSRQKFNVNNYNKVYNAAFGGAFIPSVGPPGAYDTPNGDGAVGGNPAVTRYLQGPLSPPKPNEVGWKDTHVVMPGEVTTFIVRFAPTDLPLNAPQAQLIYPFDPGEGPGYVWHCHIIDHEDNEMMRPYTVNASSYNPHATAASKNTTIKAAKTASSRTVSENAMESTSSVVLEQNSPNPFSTETEIRFTLPEPAHVRMTLYNSTGAEVQTILDATAPAGLNTVRLNAGNLKPGVYFYQLRAGLVNLVKRMVVER